MQARDRTRWPSENSSWPEGDGRHGEPGVDDARFLAAFPVRIAGSFLARHQGEGDGPLRVPEGSSGMRGLFRIRCTYVGSTGRTQAPRRRAGIHEQRRQTPRASGSGGMRTGWDGDAVYWRGIEEGGAGALNSVCRRWSVRSDLPRSWPDSQTRGNSASDLQRRKKDAVGHCPFMTCAPSGRNGFQLRIARARHLDEAARSEVWLNAAARSSTSFRSAANAFRLRRPRTKS